MPYIINQNFNINNLNFHSQIQAIVAITIYKDLDANIDSSKLTHDFNKFIGEIFKKIVDRTIETNMSLLNSIQDLIGNLLNKNNDKIQILLKNPNII